MKVGRKFLLWSTTAAATFSTICFGKVKENKKNLQVSCGYFKHVTGTHFEYDTDH